MTQDAAGADTGPPDNPGENPRDNPRDNPREELTEEPKEEPKEEPGAARDRGDPPVRVLVADDQALLRGSFRVLVDTTPGLRVVGEAGTGAQAVELAASTRPDVVLMDVRMPEMDGIEATRRICGPAATAATQNVRVLILTTFDLDEYVYAALRAGASGFLLKDTPPGEVLSAIRIVAAGEALLAPSVTRRLIAEFARQTHTHPRLADGTQAGSEALDRLTGREREVLTLIARGLSNTETAQALHLSLATVKTHVGHLLAKLHARDRAQLVIVAYETGLVTATPADQRTR